jgi:hypothetical protein
MELQELINQLKEQYERKADPSQMLLTTRLLEAELTRLSSAAAARGSAKVAVMMPSSMKIYTGQAAVQEFKAAASELKNGSQAPEIRNGSQVNGAGEFKNNPDAADLRTPAELKTAAEGRTASDVKMAPGRPAAATVKEPERGAWPFDPLAEIPTLAQQQPQRELNDVIGSNGFTPSLNDKLKANVVELSAALNDTPVRDLKKAIGVNDRFVFISQLFRGDEVMYERSIKTINGFRILPEAEYWMERELKVKLGWDENREATKHFYQLVKRRFS